MPLSIFCLVRYFMLLYSWPFFRSLHDIFFQRKKKNTEENQTQQQRIQLKTTKMEINCRKRKERKKAICVGSLCVAIAGFFFSLFSKTHAQSFFCSFCAGTFNSAFAVLNYVFIVVVASYVFFFVLFLSFSFSLCVYVRLLKVVTTMSMTV